MSQDEGDAADGATGPSVAEPAAGPSVRTTVVVSLAIGLAVTVAVLGATYVLRPSPSAGPGSAQAGIGPVSGPESRPLPDASLERLDGSGSVRLADYRGDPLLVNFWATWCPPCVEEMPDFDELAVEAAGQLAVLGVNVQDNRAAAQAFVDSLGISYDLVVDQAGRLYADLRGVGMPTTLFVDADGQVVYRHTGALDAERLRSMVSEHLRVELP